MSNNRYDDEFAYEEQGCLHEMLQRQVRKTPNAVSVVAPPSYAQNGPNNSTTTSFTLRELDERVSVVSDYLKTKCNVVADTCVGIYLDKCPEYVISYAATLRAGGGYMPLDLSYPAPLIHSILEEACPKAICTKPEFAHIFENENVPLVIFDENYETRLRNEVESARKGISWRKIPSSVVKLDNLAYLVYSSGTTGKPKGIKCPHRGAVFSYTWRYQAYPFQPDDRVACNVFFVWEMYRPLLKGISMYLIPDDVIYDPSLLCQFIRQHGITRVLFTPSLFDAILSTQPTSVIQDSFRTMRLIWLCGEVVTMTLLRRATQLLPHIHLANLYSISECHDVAAVDLTKWLKEVEGSPNGPKNTRKFAPVGKLLPGVKVAILDEQLQPQPIGMSGEIFVGGPGLALEYVNRPEVNAKRFLNTPAELVPKLGSRLYRTGDWGYLLADGNLEICGRCDTMVKVRGYSIEVQAVEASLLNTEGVTACVVIAKGEEGEDKHLVAYVVIANDANLTRRELRASLKRHLPFYMVPSYFVFLPQLPLLPASSKVDKSALPEVDRMRDVTEPEALPSTPTEMVLANLWCDVLGLTAVDVNDSFFDLGGHSLLATRLLTLVNSKFHVNLTVRDLFTEPTVAGLARVIDVKMDDPNAETVEKVGINLMEEVERYDLKNVALDLHLRAFWRSLRWNERWSQGCLLLTGATGFLGSFFIRDILRMTKLRVVCIVRETVDSPAHIRLAKTLEQVGADDKLMQEFHSRVLVFKGDVELARMGLSEEDYQYLSYDVDIVLHAAAYVNLVYPYSALRAVNVVGTQNVILFCCTNKIKPLHYISTDAVFPHGLEECEEEMSMGELWPQLTDGYGQSKWVSEQLVTKASQRGLPAVIYRLGNQAGDSKSGVWNPQDFTYLMLYGCAAVKAVPQIDWRMEMTPVNFSTSTILELATTHFTKYAGKIIHLINVAPPSCQRVFAWMEEKTREYDGYKFERVSFEKWLDLIKTRLQPHHGDSELRLLERLLDWTVKDASYFSNMSSYSRKNTDVLLAQIGKSYPVIDSKYIQNAVLRLRARGWVPKPDCWSAKPLAGRLCVVTGASSGIGEAIAKVLALEGGAKVAMLARRVDRLEEVRRQIEDKAGQASPFQCDVTDRVQVLEAIKRAEMAFGTEVDIVVNNAGVMHYTFMKNIRVHEWQQEIDVNVTGTMNVLAACLKSMVDRKCGHIVNITSDAGRKPFPGLAVYSGTKFFIEAMSSALRQEMVEHNIKVTNIQPGDVETELITHTADPEARDQFVSSSCSPDADKPKVLDPFDVAHAVFYAVTAPNHCAINEILIEPKHAPI